MSSDLRPPPKGRGSASRPTPRFDRYAHEACDDGWGGTQDESPPPATELFADAAKSVITHNDSPDVPFSRSINPYRGCEHGCVYCFARPSHAYLGLSPGLDFETRIAYKENAAARLKEELARPGYVCEPIALGVNTDAYQPAERKLGVTRSLLEVLRACRHPVTLITKSALIERDLDLLADLARDHLVHVMISVTTLDGELARRMEPRAAAPQRRLETVRRLKHAAVPVGVLFAPLIPALNDHELERVLEASRDAGADRAGYVLLRLPLELKELFEEWLRRHYPDRVDHVLSLIRQMRGGRLNDPEFGARMRGSGALADIVAGRFRLACTRLGLDRRESGLDCSRFVPPVVDDRQLALF